MSMILNPYRYAAAGGATLGSASREFNGSSDYVSFSFPTISSANVFSISFFLKPRVLTGLGIIIEGGSGQLQSYQNGSDLDCGARDDAITTVRFSPLVADQWFHVTWVVSSTTDRKLYVDGTLEATDTDSFAFGDPSGDTFFLGSRSGSSYFFDGNISEFSIYDTDLSAANAADLASGIDVSTSRLARYFGASDTLENIDNPGTSDGTNYGTTYSTDGPLD